MKKDAARAPGGARRKYQARVPEAASTISLLTARVDILFASMSAKNTKIHKGIALVEVQDPLLLEEMERDPVLKAFLGERLSDSCIAVQPQAVEDVVKRLQLLGHMPRVLE
ncbi:MAG TPA: hypothetical protein PLD73_18040 [Candidatus Hydrogenedentes bacterium]|nr:hypothetical protein [Candidatus Hydrogenedentota bacterium]